MALNNFVEHFDLRYQDILFKTNVGLKIANTRFEPKLKYGNTVTRIALDLSGVRVRAITNGVDRTVDAVTDTEQQMTINVQVGTTFAIPHLEAVQAGPLNPAMTIGKDMAMKVSNHLDAVILAETRNAFAVFDTGNLTTASANGTAITLSATTVPQLITQSSAKLFSNNAPMTSLCWVIDPYSYSQILQYPIGKDVTSANTILLNGYSGDILGAEIYRSNNLTGEAVLSMATNPSNGDTITISGSNSATVTITFLATLAATAGAVHIASTVDITRANLVEHLNNPSVTEAEDTDTGYVAFSAADQLILTDVLKIGSAAPNGVAVVNDNTANTMTIVALGSSRLTVGETFTDGTDTWTSNFVHTYFGQKGAIDVAIQDKVDMDMREEPKQRTTNILCDMTAAVKTFTDGSQYFLDVRIKNA